MADQHSVDEEVAALVVEAQGATVDYATALWIDVAPSLVAGIEPDLRALSPGVTFGGHPVFLAPLEFAPPAPSTPASSLRPSLAQVTRRVPNPLCVARPSTPDLSAISRTSAAASSAPGVGISERVICLIPAKHRLVAGASPAGHTSSPSRVTATEDARSKELRHPELKYGARAPDDMPCDCGSVCHHSYLFSLS